MNATAPQFDVFLSHNSADKPAVEEIASRLRRAGLNPYLDKWHLKGGMPWQTELARALDDCACVAVFFGSSGEGSWQKQEMQAALNRAVRTRDDYRVISVLLEGADPSQFDAFWELRTWVDFRPGLDDEIAFRALVAAIRGVAPDSVEGLAELPEEPRPYRGLERFEGDQAEFFFGRNDEIRRLIERLEDDRFVAVVGASGSGKSSLVRAGLCTEAAEEKQPGIRDWNRIVFVPGIDPLRALATGLVSHLPESERAELLPSFIQDFSDDTNGLINAWSTLFPNPNSPTILVVDQFEELFTHRPTDPEHLPLWRESTACFAANLLAAHNARSEWLRIMVTLRADFVDRFVSEDFPELRTLLEQRQFWLGAMGEEDLRDAVVRPAKLRGAFFEKGLVEMILRDMRGQTAAMPLLEEALEALWNNRRGPWFVHEAYQDSGGVGGALAKKAERIYDNLSEEDQTVARQIFLELIQLGEGTDDTRRRVPLSNLIPAARDPSRIQAVLDKFSSKRQRLISLSKENEAQTVEITHETLISHWDQLRGWLDSGRDDLRLRRRLADAAHHWNQQDRPSGSLWRPPDLELLRSLVRKTGEDLPPVQLDFYQQSDRAEKERIAAEERRRQDEIEHQKKLTEEQSQRAREQKSAANRFKWIASIAAAAALIAVLVGAEAFRQYDIANRRTDEAVEALVDSILVAGPNSLDAAIRRIEPVSRRAVPKLRWAFQVESRADRKLHAAVALATYAEAPTDFLVDAIGRAPSNEGKNLLGALSQAGASSEVKRRFDKETEVNNRARLAITSLFLEDLGPAQEMLLLRPDPKERTAFIHSLLSWYGDLDTLARITRDCRDSSARSGLCLAIGQLDVDASNANGGILRDTLLMWYQQSTDAGTHSAADWLLRQWGIDPTMETTGKTIAPTGANWLVNELGMTMIKLGPGTFHRVDPDDLHFKRNDPQEIELNKPFYICDREVSLSQFRESIAGTNYPKVPAQWKEDGSPDHPVSRVSWVDAILFCNWLSNRHELESCYEVTNVGDNAAVGDNKATYVIENVGTYAIEFDSDANGYRLPTEAEWEFASRANTTTRYVCGNEVTFLHHYAVLWPNSQNSPAQCASKLPNAWGIFDMHGNVSEWCQDDWKFYPRVPKITNPICTDDPKRDPKSKVVRGGSYFSRSTEISSRESLYAVRTYPPTGFRVVCAAPPNVELDESLR